MLWTPTPRLTGSAQNNLAATPSGNGAQITSGNPAHSNGSWTELIASTDFDVHWLVVNLATTAASNTDTSYLVDIGIGSAGNEVLLIDSLFGGWLNTGVGDATYNIPTFIPKGTRIVARGHSLIASDACNVYVFCYGRQGGVGQWHGITKWDRIGIDTSTSLGTSVTPGNSGAEGSWTSIGGTTSRAYGALMGTNSGRADGATLNNVAYHFEFGWNSTALWENFCNLTTSGETINTQYPLFPYFVSVPSGTQLQARGEASGTAQNIQVGMWGGY